jgi:hypothetical protein
MPKCHYRLYAAVLLMSAVLLNAQVDPGPRGGAANAGGFYPTLNSAEQAIFTQATGTFQEIEGVSNGLGPTFNGNSSAMCHAQPTVVGLVLASRARRIQCRTHRWPLRR